MPSLQSRTRTARINKQQSLPRFTIGRNETGRWVVHDREGRVGGIFVSEHAAVHFAADECDRDATQIAIAGDGIVLAFTPLDGNGNVH
jgi:hypothetical protein